MSDGAEGPNMGAILSSMNMMGKGGGGGKDNTLTIGATQGDIQQTLASTLSGSSITKTFTANLLEIGEQGGAFRLLLGGVEGAFNMLSSSLESLGVGSALNLGGGIMQQGKGGGKGH